MRFEACGDIHHRGAAGAVIHRAVINLVAVDGRSDSDVIDVRGEHHEFVLQRGIQSRQLAHHVRRFHLFRKHLGLGFQGGGQGEVRQRLAILAKRRNFREGVA